MALSSIERPLSGENLFREQAQTLEALVQAGAWKDINPAMFPAIPKVTVEFARENAFDSRIAYIQGQMETLHNSIETFSEKPDTQEKIYGRITELVEEFAEIIDLRFPDTKPQKPDGRDSAAVLLNRDANSAIQFFVNLGEVEALNPETLPALKHLKPETRLELQIDALLAKLGRYQQWKDTKIDGERLGFGAEGEGKSKIDELADSNINDTIAQLMKLSAERLSLKTK